MIEQIAKNDLYEVSVDIAKNRWYLVSKGNWESTTQLPDYLADCDKAMHKLTPGFTMLADATEKKVNSPMAQSLSAAVASRATALGCGKLATVATAEAAFNSQLDQLSQTVKVQKKRFTRRAEAEAWLDEK